MRIYVKKLAGSLILGSLLANSAFASDLLAKISDGAISDNSKRVKVLSLDEQKDVKGGYVVHLLQQGNEMYAIALYGTINDGSGQTKGEILHVLNHKLNNTDGMRGLCGVDVADCSGPSLRRMTEYLNITNGAYDFYPMYIVKRNTGVSNLGRRYVYFTYGTGMMDSNMQFYKFSATTSSNHLNNNMIIKEIRDKYKNSMEYALGGLSVR